MVIKNYSVTLEEKDVIEAKKRIKETGGKLSPILNRLLKEWMEKEEVEDGCSR